MRSEWRRCNYRSPRARRRPERVYSGDAHTRRLLHGVCAFEEPRGAIYSNIKGRPLARDNGFALMYHALQDKRANKLSTSQTMSEDLALERFM